MKTKELTLGGVKYKIKHLNLGEIEDFNGLFGDGGPTGLRQAYAILEIVLRRAEPQCDDIRLIEASLDELGKFNNAAMVFSGLKAADPADPNASAPAAATG